MANLRAYRDKDGKLRAYYIRVFRGRDANGKQLKPYETRFEVKDSWSETTARKKAEAFAAVFEENCRAGLQTDARQTFQEYAEYVLKLKESNNELKHSTIARYRELTGRIYPEIGYIKLRDLQAHHLNDLYTKIQDDGQVTMIASAKDMFFVVIEEKKLGVTANKQLQERVRGLVPHQRNALSKTALASASKIAQSTVLRVFQRKNIQKETADAISAALGYETDRLFDVEEKWEPLSTKTVREHHVFISSVLSIAVKEGVIPSNVASKASPPKYDRPEAEFYEPETVKQIIAAIEGEPIYWQTMAYLLIYTGARRGEIVGLYKSGLDFERSIVHILGNLLYAKDVGKYLDSTKGRKGRFVTIPAGVMEKVKQYIEWKIDHGIVPNKEWKDAGLLFINEEGEPYHPDSLTDWFSKLEKRYDLPHIHPHALRHSMASLLIFEGVDTTSVAKRLGHKSPTTTETIYAHVLQAAEQRNSDIVEKLYGA